MPGFSPIGARPVSSLNNATSGIVAYSLVGAAGSYAVTGNAGTFLVGRKLTGAAGSYAITGNAGTLTYTPFGGVVNYTLSGAAGSYTVTGFNGVFSYVDAANTGVAGGAGWPVDWQGKRRKLTLEEQPEKHLRHILDKVVAEYYGEIVEADVPKAVKAEAAQIVNPYVEKSRQTRVPKVDAIDWVALQRDVDAVSALMNLWSDEIAKENEDDDELLLMMIN